tara:strand:+ start:634 stop:864 length:231 start_codon:yes stop_codon:yes gene_type:complete
MKIKKGEKSQKSFLCFSKMDNFKNVQKKFFKILFQGFFQRNNNIIKNVKKIKVFLIFFVNASKNPPKGDEKKFFKL